MRLLLKKRTSDVVERFSAKNNSIENKFECGLQLIHSVSDQYSLLKGNDHRLPYDTRLSQRIHKIFDDIIYNNLENGDTDANQLKLRLISGRFAEYLSSFPSSDYSYSRDTVTKKNVFFDFATSPLLGNGYSFIYNKLKNRGIKVPDYGINKDSIILAFSEIAETTCSFYEDRLREEYDALRDRLRRNTNTLDAASAEIAKHYFEDDLITRAERTIEPVMTNSLPGHAITDLPTVQMTESNLAEVIDPNTPGVRRSIQAPSSPISDDEITSAFDSNETKSDDGVGSAARPSGSVFNPFHNPADHNNTNQRG